MGKRIGRVLLWAFVVTMGIQLGGGIYEARVVVPRWADPPQLGGVASAMESSGHNDAGLRFWAFVSPPVGLLALANAVAAWRVGGNGRTWWLGAAVAVLVGTVATYVLFVPTLGELSRAEASPEAERTAASWARLNYLRLAGGLLAWLAALRALSLSEKDGG